MIKIIDVTKWDEKYNLVELKEKLEEIEGCENKFKYAITDDDCDELGYDNSLFY